MALHDPRLLHISQYPLAAHPHFPRRDRSALRLLLKSFFPLHASTTSDDSAHDLFDSLLHDPEFSRNTRGLAIFSLHLRRIEDASQLEYSSPSPSSSSSSSCSSLPPPALEKMVDGERAQSTLIAATQDLIDQVLTQGDRICGTDQAIHFVHDKASFMESADQGRYRPVMVAWLCSVLQAGTSPPSTSPRPPLLPPFTLPDTVSADAGGYFGLLNPLWILMSKVFNFVDSAGVEGDEQLSYKSSATRLLKLDYLQGEIEAWQESEMHNIAMHRSGDSYEHLRQKVVAVYAHALCARLFCSTPGRRYSDGTSDHLLERCSGWCCDMIDLMGDGALPADLADMLPILAYPCFELAREAPKQQQQAHVARVPAALGRVFGRTFAAAVGQLLESISRGPDAQDGSRLVQCFESQTRRVRW